MAETIDIVRKVLVRSVVNTKLRSVLSAEVDGNLQNLERDFQAFSRHRDAYVNQCREKDVKPDYEVMKRMAMEEEKFRGQKDQWQRQLGEIRGLVDGEEFVHGTVDSLVSVGIGSNWHSVMTGVEVLLEDGVVKEIRHKEVKL